MKKLIAIAFLLPAFGVVAQSWEKNYQYVDNCICGLAKVQKNGKIGYVTKEGVEVIKPIFDEGLTFKEGYTAVRQGAKWQFLDSTGKAITGAVYDDAIGFNNGLAAVSKDNLYGFINIKGEEVIPLQFSGARNFSEGLAPAANNKGYWGYINRQGGWAIKPVYDFTDSFENGEARVMKGQKMFYIDKDNKVLHE